MKTMNYYMRNNQVPKCMPKREREALLTELKELHRIATMEYADFGEDTEYIKDETRLYRESWLVVPLERLISRYSQAGAG